MRHWFEHNGERRLQPIAAQHRHEGLRAPVAERRLIDEPLAARCPAGGLDHVGLHRSLVEKPEPVQHVGHEGLAPRDPDMACPGHIGPLLLSRAQVFFCA
jgi:hypothetical protein